jgi:chondroitin AC lyase
VSFFDHADALLDGLRVPEPTIVDSFLQRPTRIFFKIAKTYEIQANKRGKADVYPLRYYNAIHWFPPMMHFTFLLRRAVLALCALLLAAVRSVGADIDTIQTRLEQQILSSSVSSSIQTWLNTLNNGRWPDIDYTDKSRTSWKPYQHLVRLLALARAYRKSGQSFYNSPAVRAAYLAAYDSWVNNRPTSDNWWQNDLGGPGELSHSMLLMKSQLTAAQFTAGRSALGRAGTNAVGSAPVVSIGTMTGQNLVWYYEIRIYLGCALDDVPLVDEGFGEIEGEIFISSNEGIRPDFSFHQHGRQLYSGGYGKAFAGDTTKFAALARGTSFAFSPAKLDLLSSFILDHMQWSMRGQTFDFGIVGREIARANVTHARSSIRNICSNMLLLDSPREAEFQQFYNRASGTAATAISGNRHFYNSDFMTHQRPGYYASVRMHSTRTHATENYNGENLLGHHLATGVFSIYVGGDEYYNIFPIWNWRRLPGVTCKQSGALPPATIGYGTTTFVGGVSNGRFGVAAYDQDREGVTASKSWFMFDNEIVALGAGITPASAADSIATTVNQCFWNGTISLHGGGTAARGQRTLPGTSWVHHGNVGYYFPSQPATVTLRADAQSGSWKTISNSGSASGTNITDDVFSLWLDHGTNVSNASYQYHVVPGATPVSMQTYAAGPPVQRLVNTAALQAVRHPGLGVTGIAYFQPGQLQIEAGLNIASDQACLVLYVEKTDGQVELSVSNPRNAALTVNLDVTQRLTGTGAVWNAGTGETRVTFALPSGNGAGDTVTRTFTLVTATPPEAPADLVASARGSAGIDLAWTDASDDETAFVVERSVDGAPFQALSTRPAGATGFTLTSALPLTAYRFRVHATNAAGNSAWSNEAGVLTGPELGLVNYAAAASVLAFSAEQTGNEAARLIDGISHHDLNRWSAQNFPQWIEIDLGQNRSISASELIAIENRAYRYRIEARPQTGSYATLVDRTANTQPSPLLDRFAPVTARYLRLTVTGASGYTGPWISLREWRILGSEPATVLSPVADATVRGGTSAALNFGSEPQLMIKADGNDNFNRLAYLRFDLATLTRGVQQAALRLAATGAGSDGATTTFTVALVANDTWTETGLTWDTRPAGSDILATWEGGATAGSVLEFDLTAAVNAQLVADRKLSLVLASTTPGSNRSISFGSREAADAAVRPQLIVRAQPANIPPEPLTYTNWRAYHFGTGALADGNPAADPDRDGMSNALEFALGGNPRSADAADHLPQMGRSPDGQTLSLHYRKSTPELALPMQWSRTLGAASWSVQGVSSETYDAATDTFSQSVTVSPLDRQMFLRLAVP